MKKFFTLVLLSISFAGFSQSLSEVYYPLYIQGVGSGNVADDRKVPFACRMTVSGLTPNATYRYYNRFVTDPVATDNGQGNYIIANQTGDFIRVTAASLATAGRYGEFTTSAAGSYTGWFIVEPSIATTHYQPGTLIYFRLLLNNGAGGGAVVTRATATNPVTVLGFGSLPTQGTGLRSTAVAAFTAKNFVLFYDNESGTGRPVAATFVESDGTVNDATTSYYAPFYANSVDGIDKTWGTIIPNNLATGIRRIAQHRLSDGTHINGLTTTNGIYGGVSTANASGGLNELVINGSLTAPLPVSLGALTASVSTDKVKLEWKTATESNLLNYTIERSSNGTDFTRIGNKTALGSNKTYSFEDNLLPGVTYYRLKMVDADGTFTYSRVLTVNGNASVKKLSVFPNPVTSDLVISHAKAKAGAMAEVVSLNGVRLFSQKIQQNNIQSTVSVSHLISGSYVLIYHNGGEKQIISFKKQ